MKFVSYRRDIISRTSYPINQLLCFKIIDNKLVYDKSRSIKARSFYIYKSLTSINELVSNKKFKKYQVLENFTSEIQKAKLDVK